MEKVIYWNEAPDLENVQGKSIKFFLLQSLLNLLGGYFTPYYFETKQTTNYGGITSQI